MNEGVQVLPLRLRGRSTSVGAKKELVGGVDKVAEDFKPKFTFVNPSELKNQTGESAFYSYSCVFVLPRNVNL